ncbi:MAG TPA: carboxypeptidase-like regulatory domain-containing protein, partial [Flavobacteriales bacterium]|nr:carboxypeptidase-like regulatory domain-containing protein [Flavobacteriales bacterium]
TVSQAMGQQLVEFKVRNIGAGSTGALSLSLPQAPWLSAMTPVNMPAIAPGDSALVILRFLAHVSVPFDFPVNGTIALNGANSNSLVIPFSFMKVSVTTGTLTVDAVNQFTFFDPTEPHVAGASVEVRHAYSNMLLASGITDVNGLFTATNIPEGTHRLIVSKAQHLPYDQPVTINPGATLNRTTFLNYQAITFSWNVVPTAIQDQYDVTLTMVFQTNVPVPVVDLILPDTFPQLFGSEVFAFNAVLTNHGLINALGVELLLPENDPEYEFITNYTPTTIPALTSIQVPVLMRVRQTPLMAGQENIDEDQRIADFLGITGHGMQRSGLSCKLYTGTRWYYHCNFTTGLWERGSKSTPIRGRVCIYDPNEPGQAGDQGSPPNCPGCPDPVTIG